MPCLAILLAFFAPRVVLILLFLFSHFLSRAFSSNLWLLLGFSAMPYTTLAYAAAINWHGEITGVYAFAYLLAALLDLGVIGGSIKPTLLR